MNKTTFTSAFLAAVFASGCTVLFGTDDFLGDDAGPQQQVDSGPRPDGSTPDSGPADSGPSDSGPADSGPADAGPSDSGPGDAGCTMTKCGETCTDTSRDPLHCGGCDNACPDAPENATATCTEGECGFVCNAGHDLVVGACAPRPAPRPIGPMSTSTTTSKRPTFRWELAPRNDGARVEICADRACISVITRFDALGTSGRPATDLPTGVVFWRLYGLRGDDVGTVPSVTWQAYIRARSAPVDTSWGTVSDVNGDGFADLLRRGESGELHVHHGSPTGIASTPSTVITAPDGAGPNFASSFGSAGDVNGDGFADVIVGAPGATGTTGRVFLYLGGPAGLESTPTTILEVSSTDSSFGRLVWSAGDNNGDGYGDVLITWAHRPYVYLGSPSGLHQSSRQISSELAVRAVLCDVNGDGLADLAVSNPSSPVDIGSVSIHMGSGTDLFERTASLTIEGPDGPGSFFSEGLACGDLNGDGYADIIAGNASEASRGHAYVFRGSPEGLIDEIWAMLAPDPPGYYFGARIASSDFDGDGFDDVVLSDYQRYPPENPLRLYRGSAEGIETTPAATIPDPRVGYDGGFGSQLMNIGDVDADGFADLYVGSWGTADHIYLGAASGLRMTPSLTLSP